MLCYLWALKSLEIVVLTEEVLKVQRKKANQHVHYNLSILGTLRGLCGKCGIKAKLPAFLNKPYQNLLYSEFIDCSFEPMWMICKKEWNQFFSSLTGYIALVVFLLLNGLMFFVFPDTSLLDFGYASLDGFFSLAPWILLFLIPTITMRSLADEYKAGTFELLKTLPLTASQIVWGKFLGALLIVLLALIPTAVYAFSLQHLSAAGGIDVGASVGSYIGLFLLGAVFTSVSLCASSFTNNTVVAFISGAFVCLILYTGFDALSKLPFLSNGPDYYVQMLGINFHYKSISKGVIDVRDMIYFFAIILFFIAITKRNIESR